MTEFRFCELQNRRKQCRSFVQIMMRSQKIKVLHRNSNGFFSQNQVISKKKVSMLISKCHLMGPFRAFLKPMGSLMGPPKSMGPGVITPPSRWPCSPVHIGVYCTFTVPVQVFLVLLQTVTGLAVSYVPVAGYQYHTRLTLTVK